MTDETENSASDGPQKRGPGRPKAYPKWSNTERGAPKLVVRVDPDVFEHVQSRPEGARPYIESLVRAERDSKEARNG